MLNSTQIRRLTETRQLVSDYVDLETQLQPAGFDLSLREVQEFTDGGAIDFSNAERVLAPTRVLPWGADDWLFLSKGCYVVVYNEVIQMPLDTVALARSRSTLLRNGGCVETAVWDPGYHGRSSSLLVVENPFGLRLKRNARIAQLVFFPVSKVKKGYSGVYQNERMK